MVRAKGVCAGYGIVALALVIVRARMPGPPRFHLYRVSPAGVSPDRFGQGRLDDSNKLCRGRQCRIIPGLWHMQEKSRGTIFLSYMSLNNSTIPKNHQKWVYCAAPKYFYRKHAGPQFFAKEVPGRFGVITHKGHPTTS